MHTPASTPRPLRLPNTIEDYTLPALFAILGSYAEKTPLDEPLVLDMQSVKFYTPGAIAALLATIHHWLRQKRPVSLLNAENAPAFKYWQRMDFFTHCGIKFPEKFRRHDSTGRFVSLRRITSADERQVTAISEEIAGCLFPDQAALYDPELTGPYDLVQYATTELINNVIQHSRSAGFILAQVFPKQNTVRIAIVDFGIGIRGSFAETSPSFWDASMDDVDSVALALQPKVSSKMHVTTGWSAGTVNAGVGLSITKELAHDTNGIFTLASHAGFYQSNHCSAHNSSVELTLPQPFPGTLCALQVAKDKLINNVQLLQNAKERLRLLDKTHPFDNLFES